MRDPEEPVRLIRESLPVRQKEREVVFAEKFAGALAYFHGRKLQNVRANPDRYGFPDIFAKADGKPVGIEVLEIHDSGRRNRVLESKYVRTLISRLENESVLVPGLWITVRVESLKGVPRLNSSRGRKMVDAIEGVLMGLLPTYTGLKEGTAQRKRKSDPRALASFDVLAWKIGGVGTQVNIKFPQEIGGRTTVSVITGPLLKKLRKYSPQGGMPLYLLVVEWDRNIKTEDALDRAEKVASSIAHAFREIWYMQPYPNESFGFIHRVWPASLAQKSN